MKIGILTLHLGKNYGGVLQAFALQTILERMGHQVEVIKWEQNQFNGFPYYKAPFIYVKRLIRGVELFKEYREQREDIIIFQNLHKSISHIIHYSKDSIKCREDLIRYCNEMKFDALVVGSDQVWRKSYGDDSIFNRILPNNSFPDLKTYYLDFTKDLDYKPICISYAASFGVDYVEYKKSEADKLGLLLTGFDGVSVREKQALDLIESEYKWRNDVKCVLDPSMLLTQDDYCHLFVHEKKMDDPSFILYYILDESESKNEIVRKVSSDLSLEIKRISPNCRCGGNDIKVLPSFEEWISSFANADYVITDSFHGMVLSLIFNKRFIVIGNKKRGASRMYSLLDDVKLLNRSVESVNNIDSLIDGHIDWSSAKSILEENVFYSLNYLKSFLEK